MPRLRLGTAAALLALAGCAAPGSTEAASPTTSDPSAAGTVTTSPSMTTSRGAYEEIEFRLRNGEVRSGRLFGEGQVAVVLSHMGREGDGQDDWEPFAEDLADRGVQVLTYTHLGVEVWQDVLGAVDYLRESGAKKVIAGGASLGAMASLYAAEQSGSDINGLIWLAGVLRNSGYEFTRASVSKIACPMLIASGDQDAYDAGDDAPELHSWVRTSELLIVRSMLHGTDVLGRGGEPADQLEKAMLALVDRVKSRTSTC